MDQARSASGAGRYVLLTFCLTWIPWGLAATAAAPGVSPLLLPLGALGPALAAVVMMGAREGRRGVLHLLGRLRGWQLGWGWTALAFLWGPFLAASGSALLLATGSASVEQLGFTPLPRLIIGALLFVPLFVSLEEIGWRGYALPRLQARFTVLHATVLVGVVHGFWHLPLYWIPEAGMHSLSPLNFTLFMAGIVAGAVVLTALFNASGGKLWPVIAAHASYNVFVNGVVVADAQRPTYELATVVVAIAAAAVVAWLMPQGRSGAKS